MQADANEQLYPPPEFSLKRNVLRWVLVMLAMILQLPLGLSGTFYCIIPTLLQLVFLFMLISPPPQLHTLSLYYSITLL